jgi:hypothetical protein
MGFLVSPGVDVNEIDLTNVIPAVSTSIGGIVGHFKWGPVEELVSVGSETELVATYGKPDSNNFGQWLQASAFLQYGSALNVYRFNSTSLNNSSSGGGTYLIKNRDNYEGQTLANSPIDYFVARYPGALGNSLQVCVITNQNYANNAEGTATGAVTAAPIGDSPLDNIHIVIIDEDGLITGTADTVLEVFENVTVTSGTKYDNGTSSYYIDVLENSSAYVWPTSNVISPIDYDSPTTDTNNYNFSLSGGSDGSAPTTANLQAVYTTAFGDSETIDVNILIGPTGADTSAVGYAAANAVNAVASTRKDCVAVVSPPTTGSSGTALQSTIAGAVTNAKTWADSITTDSYGILTSTAAYVYDKYNDVYRWIGSAGHVAGLLANVDDVAEPWFSPAGYNRGQLRGVVKLGYNPSSSQRDTLYKARVNPLVSFPGAGLLLFGDKTAQIKPSAFDRINVRRLFIILEKAISTASKYQLFELNDEFTRAMFRNMTEPFLRDVKGRRGITDFLVVCDETNNTGEVIDTNRFVADIYIKPARSINFITLNFIATRTGVEFSEIAG